jgi:hypothetical protein
MRVNRSCAELAILVALVLVCGAGAAQAQTFRTPWGHPDLQGIWNNQTVVPFERPPELAGKEFFTEKEAAELERTHLKRLNDLVATFEPISACIGTEASCVAELATVLDDSRIGPNRRTALVMDPRDGRIPFTPDGRQRWLAVPSVERMLLGVGLAADAPSDRTLVERCVTAGGLFDPNPFYNNYHLILQTPDHVAIVMEELHEHRIIPLDGRPHVGPNLRQWLGDSRGRWEGQTLVVDTARFNDKLLFRGATSQLRLVERFTRRDASTIVYHLTVTDPATFTRPWTVENGLRKSDAMLYESACHEHNYGLANILSAARAAEKK